MKKICSQTLAFYRRDIHRIFVRSVIAFIILCVIGTVSVRVFGIETMASLLSRATDVTPPGSIVEDDNTIVTWYGYLIQNSRADLLTLLLGFVPFIYLPAFVLAYNAAALGGMTGLVAIISERSVFNCFLYGVAPHGILEYAVNCLAFSLGIYLCKVVTDRIRKKGNTSIKSAVINCVLLYLLIVLPGLLVAGIIEANITPAVMAAAGL